MMDARSANRLRLALILTITAALALGSFWLLEVLRKSGERDQPSVNQSDPDYYMERFQFIRISQIGKPQFSISGQHMTHFPADDTYVIQSPIAKSLSNERPPMFASAKKAIVDRINDKIHMYDDVHIDRSADEKNERLQLKTTYLMLLTDEDIMQTDKPVLITLGQSVLRGTGMLANNATGELKLSSNVHVTYQKPQQ